MSIQKEKGGRKLFNKTSWNFNLYLPKVKCNTYIYMYAYNNYWKRWPLIKKGGTEFEKEQGEIYERLWREGGNDVITLKSQKRKDYIYQQQSNQSHGFEWEKNRVVGGRK